MPKGSMGIWSTGTYFRVRLPQGGQCPHGVEQTMLVALNEQKEDVINDLIIRCPSPPNSTKTDAIWNDIIASVGSYLGQTKRGLPPTTAERDRSIDRIAKAADKLNDEIGAAGSHVRNLIKELMRRQDTDINELAENLDALNNLQSDIANMRFPKGRPDPYAEYLIRELAHIWAEVRGKRPGKTGDPHDDTGQRTSPFYRWCSRISDVGIGKKLPRDLIDTVIRLEFSDG